MPQEDEAARQEVAAEVRRIREAAQEASVPHPATLPPARGTRDADEIEPVAFPAAAMTPRRPDVGGLHPLAALASAPPSGFRGLVFRLLRRALGPLVQAEIAFNRQQARLDEEMLAYIDARTDATHRHYDAVLGQYGQHIADANDRHLRLQADLIAHVHDLIERIDLVLEQSERGRLSLDAALRDLRARLVRLEERGGR